MTTQVPDVETAQKQPPADAPQERQLGLIDDDDEQLEPDGSDEAADEAGMTDGVADLLDPDDIEFETTESEEAQ
jgi:hypothetical protein